MLQTLKSLGVSGSITRTEVSFPDWSDECHLHFHSLIDTPASGRGYVSKGAFTDAWMSNLPADLLPPVVEVDIDKVNNLAAATSYLCESAFHKFVREKKRADIEEVSRTLDAIRETKGLPKLVAKGSLKLPARPVVTAQYAVAA
jgi:hypothetical protein